MKVDLAKELYNASWSRRDQLTGSVATPISVATAIGGAVVLMVRSFEVDISYRALLFALAVSLAAIALALAAYNLTRSYFGYDYQTIPTAQELANYFTSLEEYFKAKPSADRSADQDFTKYLFARYVEAAEANTINNESKAAFLHRATQSLIIAMVATAAAAVPWSLADIDRESPPQRMEIVAPITVKPANSHAFRRQAETGAGEPGARSDSSGTQRAAKSAGTRGASTRTPARGSRQQRGNQ